MRNVEEWAREAAKNCASRDNHPAKLPSLFICPDCAELFARSYARECVEAWREKAAYTVQNFFTTLQESVRAEWKLSAIAAALRALPGETP